MILAKPNIEGFEDVRSTDVPTIFQMSGDDKWYMAFIGYDGKGYQSFVAESDNLLNWTNMRLAMGFGKKGEFDFGAIPSLYKEGDGNHALFTQLQPNVELENLETESRSRDIARSEVLERHVYVEESRGANSVRTLITWQTHKHELDSSFPAFLFCHVDYSPTRKAPLKRGIRVGSSREAVD